MKATEPLQLFHSWPLSQQRRQFELGHILNCAVTDAIEPESAGMIGFHHVGCWQCNLPDNSLTWSGGVYDIFGLPRFSGVAREEAVALYSEESRAALDRLRAHAIKYRRGFTLDAEIRPVAGESRWMRLIAAPVCEDDKVVALRGLKVII